MGRMQIVLSDKMEDKLRKKIASQMGLKKGNISLAIEEAINEWLDKE